MTSPQDQRADPGASMLFDRRPPAALSSGAGTGRSGALVSTPARPRLREREGVLSELVASFRGQSRGGPVIVEGAPGLGKTALLNAALHLAREEGLAVLNARGSQLEAAFPFSVVRQLFEHLLALLEPDRRHECLQSLGSGVLTGDRQAGEDELPSVFDDFRRAISFLAEHQPLVIALDDLHWCDPASARWFEYLSRRLERGRVWLLGSTLERWSTEAKLAVDRVVADPATRTFVLEPLSADSVGELVAEQFCDPGLDELAAACARVTGGNPFLLFALLSWLRGGGACDAEHAASMVDRAVPPQVVRALVHRTHGLPDGAYRLAQAAAVLGDQAGVREAAELAGLDLEAAKVAADALAEAAVLARDGALRFVHPLERSALYGDLGPASRATLHEQAARLLDGQGAPVEVVAEHLALAEPAMESWRSERLVQAAELAAAAGDTERAQTLLVRALAEPPGPELRGSILVALATHSAPGAPTEALDRLREAGLAGVEPVRYARAALDTFSRLPESDRAAARDVLQAAAVGLAGHDEAELRLRLGITLAHVLPTVEGARSVAPLLEQTLAGRLIGRSLEERAALGYLCSSWELTPDRLPAPQLVAAGLGAVRVEDLELAGEVVLAGDVVLDGAVRALEAAVRAGGLQEAEALARRAEEAARRAGHAGAESALSIVVARCLATAGRLREANEVLCNVLRAPRPDFCGLRAEVLAAQVALELGEGTAAATLLEQVAQSAQRARSLAELSALEVRAEAQYREGAVEAALADFRLAGQLAEDWGVRNPAVTCWRAGAALACFRLGDSRGSHELASENLSFARAFGAPLVVGVALRVMAEVVEPVERLALLDEAVTLLEPAGSSLELARATLELGRTLRLAERPVAARTALRQAADLAVRCGAPRLIERSMRELRASGARPRRLAFSGADSLTPSERRVAQLAAAGMKNARIAEQLFVTTKTVEGHLSRVYQKLGVQSREELRRVVTTAMASRPDGGPLAAGRTA